LLNVILEFVIIIFKFVLDVECSTVLVVSGGASLEGVFQEEEHSPPTTSVAVPEAAILPEAGNYL
jgi:hypothetical protein